MADQNSGPGVDAFPAGGGELGQLIRDFDWSTTSLGPISGWPQSLRTATDIVLQSPIPLVMLWGPDGIMIYNDGYAVFAASRHPELLGSKVLEGWPEAADRNRNVLDTCYHGGGTLSYKKLPLTLYRNKGEPDDLWLDLSHGPVLDKSGKPGGMPACRRDGRERALSRSHQSTDPQCAGRSQRHLHLKARTAPSVCAASSTCGWWSTS